MNHFKKKLTAYTAMLAFLSLSSAVAYAGGVVDGIGNDNVLGKTGNMNLSESGNRTNVNLMGGQHGAVGQVDWKNFSVGSDGHVNFGFSGLSQTIINRVLGGKTSTIMGKMTSSCVSGGSCESFGTTGKVLLINPAGIMFGAGSQVDINSFTASTFDMKGAKNIKDLSAQQLNEYQNSVLRNAGHFDHVDKNGNTVFKEGSINLDSNYTQAFEDAGIKDADKMIQGSKIQLNGATFNHFAKDANGNFDFNKEAGLNTNKSTVFVSNNIEYKDSIIKTGSNLNYNKGSQSFSNVKLVTADGVNFNYYTNGAVKDKTISENDNHADLARTISIDNAGLLAKDPSQASIVAGNIDIHQSSKVAGDQPGIKIKDTIVKGVKLVNGENGNIEIKSSQDVLVDHSRMTTENLKDGSTFNQYGGEINIRSDKDITVNDTLIVSSGSYGTAADSINSGATRIIAGNNANVTNSKIVSDGNTRVKAGNKTTIDNSLVQAYNTTDTTVAKDLDIYGGNGVDIHNSDLDAKGNINILAADVDKETGKVIAYTGDINITSDKDKSIAENDKNGANQSLMIAGKAINIQGKNTTIDNVAMAYSSEEGLNFYDPANSDAAHTNNVTIKNNTLFAPISESGSVSLDVSVETNGNLTLDNTNVQRTQTKLSFERNSDGSLKDDGSIGGVKYNTVDTLRQGDAAHVNIKSTNGNVTVTNGSNINATRGLNITADKGSYTQDKASTVSSNGSKSSGVLEEGNVSITAAKDVSITQRSTVQARENVDITSTNGNIKVAASDVLAKTGNASLTANAGKVDVMADYDGINDGYGGAVMPSSSNSRIEAANDVNIKGNKGVNVIASKVIAGSDSEGFDVEKDTSADPAKDTIGDVNITADNGDVNIGFGPIPMALADSSTEIKSQDKDVNITASGTVNIANADVTAAKAAKVSGKKGVSVNKSTVTANNGDVTLTASAGNINIENSSKIKSTKKNVKATASGDVKIAKSTVEAKDSTTVKAGKNYTQDASKVYSYTGDTTITADGSATVQNNSEIESANNSTVQAKGDVKVAKSSVIAGSDKDGFDITKDKGDEIGNANITSTDGSVFITDSSKVLSQDKDVNITAKNTIKFGDKEGDNISKTADITAKDNVKITSTAGNIEGEKTTMPTIKYGERLTFDAAKSNIFTSQDSLKSVNVDYIAGESNRFYTQGDNQFVNSSLKSPENFIESGKDVILNNLEIKQATDKPENTVTEIYANGNVTTFNVTGEELGAKDAGDFHTFPQSVDTNRVEKGKKTMPEYVKGLESTKLDLNQTKLKVTTDTVKDKNNPDNGSITLVLQDADNTKAGVELKARNVKKLNKDSDEGLFEKGYYVSGDPQWDENIKAQQGPEILLDAADGKVAIKELYSDKLTLDVNDKIFADNSDGKTPVITVKDQGGFNLDPDLEYNKDGDGTKVGDGFTYDKDYESHVVHQEGGDLEMDPDWSEWKQVGEPWVDDEGRTHTTYESTRDGRITDRITTTQDEKHTITFDNEGNPGEFTLVYDKQETKVDPGHDITAQMVKDDPSILDDVVIHDPDPENPDVDPDRPATPDDFIKIDDQIEDCPDVPTIDKTPDVLPVTDDVSRVTLPREQLEVSRNSTVVDDTADQTSNIMSAAARVDLGNEAEGEYDSDEEDDDLD